MAFWFGSKAILGFLQAHSSAGGGCCLLAVPVIRPSRSVLAVEPVTLTALVSPPLLRPRALLWSCCGAVDRALCVLRAGLGSGSDGDGGAGGSVEFVSDRSPFGGGSTLTSAHGAGPAHQQPPSLTSPCQYQFLRPRGREL